MFDKFIDQFLESLISKSKKRLYIYSNKFGEKVTPVLPAVKEAKDEAATSLYSRHAMIADNTYYDVLAAERANSVVSLTREHYYKAAYDQAITDLSFYTWCKGVYNKTINDARMKKAQV